MQSRIEIVWVGSASHLKRYSVVDENGKAIPRGLFRTLTEAEQFLAAHEAKGSDKILLPVSRDEANSLVELIALEVERLEDFDQNDREAADYDPSEAADWLRRLRDRILETPGVH